MPEPKPMKSPALEEKSPFAEGPYKDTMGHGFKTPQALAGHIRQTGHMPILAPQKPISFGLEALFGSGQFPELKPKEQKFKYHPLNYPVRIRKTPDNKIIISRPRDFEPGEANRTYNLKVSILDMIKDAMLLGKKTMDETTKDVLKASGNFDSEEAENLTNTFMLWSGGSLVNEVRDRLRQEDNDLIKFRDNYWEFLQHTVEYFEPFAEKYKEYDLPDVKSYHEIKKAITKEGKIKLYRGLTVRHSQFKSATETGEVSFVVNNADSWSADKKTAKNFATRFHVMEDRIPVLLEYDADPEDVVMGWPFVGLPGEAEFVLNLLKTEDESHEFKITHWEDSGTELKLVRIEKKQKIQKALYESKKDKIYWDLTGRNDYAVEKHRGLTAITAVNMAKAYIRGPYRIRITRTKRGYTLSLLPPEKMVLNWLEKPVRGVKGMKGIRE